jgi:hypothetical protein
VRSVVHACLPETIDRYYQEVGRAGRDGRPTVAFLCTGPNDERIAERLNAFSMIGDDRGWRRWSVLLNAAQRIGDSRYRVRKSTLPTYMDSGYGRSARWNVRTLTLMAQANIIRLLAPRWVSDPDVTDSENQVAAEMFFAEVEDFIDFELADGTLLNQSGWMNAMSKVRSSARKAQGQSLRVMKQLADEKECAGRLIAKHYRVTHQGGILSTNPVCRGCPVCRRAPDRVPGVWTLEPCPRLPAPRNMVDPLAVWRGGHPALFIWHDVHENVSTLLIRLAQRGVSVYAGVPNRAAQRLQKNAGQVPIILDDPDSALPLEDNYPGVVVSVIPDGRFRTALEERLSLGLITYIVGPKETMDPTRPGWQFRDTAVASISVTALLMGF